MSNRVPRGVRLNNPGNLRRNAANDWQGRVPLADDPDPSFEAFASPEFGIRALALTLMTYAKRYGCDTINKLIARFAPPEENDTRDYIADVSRGSGFAPDAALDMQSVVHLAPIVTAIIRHENGVQPYSRELIAKGVQMAGAS